MAFWVIEGNYWCIKFIIRPLISNLFICCHTISVGMSIILAIVMASEGVVELLWRSVFCVLF